MKLVIDIPEEMYLKIKDTNIFISGKRSGKSIDYILFNAVNNGIPLSKELEKIKCEILLDEEEFGYYDWGVINIIDGHILKSKEEKNNGSRR